MRYALRTNIAVALTGLILTSCTTPAQRQYQAIVANNQTVAVQGISCATTVYNSPEAASIQPRIPLNSRDASLAQLADPNYASPQEITAIQAVHPQIKVYGQQAVDGIARGMPGVAAILSRSNAEGENDTVQLVQRRMTWGQYNTQRRDRALAAQAAVLAEGGRQAGAFQAQDAIQREQRQRYS